MEQRMTLEPRQSQTMVMTPRMQQAIKMLQMTALDLEALVDQELIENPVLEEVPMEDINSPDTTESGASQEIEQPSENQSSSTDGDDSDWGEGSTSDNTTESQTEGDHLTDGKIELQDDWESFFEDSSDYYTTTTVSGFDGPLDEEFEKVVPDNISLRQELERQVEIALDEELDKEIGMCILNSLDGDGYLVIPVEELANQFDVPETRIERVLNIIHGFDPPGIAARNLEECLEIQYRSKGLSDPNLLTMIREHLGDLERRRYQQIARSLKIPIAQVQELADSLSHFDPRPGRSLTAFENDYVVPEVTIEGSKGTWTVRLNDDGIVPLRVSPKYRQMMENKGTLDKDTLKFLRGRLHSAVDLIRNIEQRKQTLYKVTQEIANQQSAFLENGVTHLKPMILRDVADIIGVHETTVCRVVNGKYVDTPQGVFELKYFFSSGLKSEGGGDTSSRSVKALIQEMIDGEDPKKPLSDQKISDLLKTRGIKVARRTVAKYREELGINPTSMRKRV